MNTFFASTRTENLKPYKGESETNEDQRLKVERERGTWR